MTRTTTTLDLATLLTDASIDITKLKKSEIGNLGQLAVAILEKEPITFNTSVGTLRELLKDLKQTVTSWSERDQKRLISRYGTGTIDMKDLILTSRQRSLYRKIGINDCLKEIGDDDILEELDDSDDPDTILDLLQLIVDSASPRRKREIITRYARRASKRKKQQELQLESDRQAKRAADQMINSILFGVKAKVDRCAETTTKTLEVETKPIEGITELTVQSQIDKTLTVVNAAEHMLRLAEREPRITKNQQLAVDYLKETRAKNLQTFETIRNRLEIHASSGCKLTTAGQIVHNNQCLEQTLTTKSLLEGFVYGMTEIQPAVRHAMRVLLGRELVNLNVDYAWVMTQDRIPKPERFIKKGNQNKTSNKKHSVTDRGSKAESINHQTKPQPSSQ